MASEKKTKPSAFAKRNEKDFAIDIPSAFAQDFATTDLSKKRSDTPNTPIKEYKQRFKKATSIVTPTGEDIDEDFDYSHSLSSNLSTDSDWEDDDHKMFSHTKSPDNMTVVRNLVVSIYGADLFKGFETEKDDILNLVNEYSQRGNSNESIKPDEQKQVTTKETTNDANNKENKNRDENWAKKRKIFEKELIETEQSYILVLKVLINDIITPIFSKKLLDEKYKKSVLLNLPQILTFHEFFLQELMKGDIVNVFKTSSDFLKMYIAFVNGYPCIMDIFSEHGQKKKNKKLYKFLKQKRKEKKALTNHLIAPVQRIPRYLLLLENMKKYTPQTHKEYTEIDEALNKIASITNHINENQRQIDNMSQCMQIQSKLHGMTRNIVEPARNFLNQFGFYFKNKSNQFHQFCVFNDIIIICDSKWKVLEIIDMRIVYITEINKGFELKYLDKKKLYYLDDASEIDEFVKEIQQCKASLFDNDMTLLNAEKKAISKAISGIKQENIIGIGLQLGATGSNKSDKGGGRGSVGGGGDGNAPKKEIVWGRKLRKNDKNVMDVEWRFIDENDEPHFVLLKHEQIKGNKKSFRSLCVDGNQKLKDKAKSNKNKFKFDLADDVKLSINIEYDSKNDKFTYPLKVNDKTYGQVFNQWQQAQKNK